MTPEQIFTQFGVGGFACWVAWKIYNDLKTFMKQSSDEQKEFTEKIMEENAKREENYKEIINDQNTIIQVQLKEIKEEFNKMTGGA